MVTPTVSKKRGFPDSNTSNPNKRHKHGKEEVGGIGRGNGEQDDPAAIELERESDREEDLDDGEQPALAENDVEGGGDEHPTRTPAEEQDDEQRSQAPEVEETEEPMPNEDIGDGREPVEDEDVNGMDKPVPDADAEIARLNNPTEKTLGFSIDDQPNGSVIDKETQEELKTFFTTFTEDLNHKLTDTVDRAIVETRTQLADTIRGSLNQQLQAGWKEFVDRVIDRSGIATTDANKQVDGDNSAAEEEEDAADPPGTQQLGSIADLTKRPCVACNDTKKRILPNKLQCHRCWRVYHRSKVCGGPGKKRLHAFRCKDCLNKSTGKPGADDNGDGSEESDDDSAGEPPDGGKNPRKGKGPAAKKKKGDTREGGQNVDHGPKDGGRQPPKPRKLTKRQTEAKARAAAAVASKAKGKGKQTMEEEASDENEEGENEDSLDDDDLDQYSSD
ncbi:hypothetical protein EJ08DRAFT_659911 [Tothia fuscella]|uniref:Uncharacterized protein n=1 Tax=Tothia fuscella TaxID=1048955 RepID=A0A9P4NSZ2_9PEZI|nr:hypothetical protein EJ08DRAFT_659911 [Tothia fuscella]